MPVVTVIPATINPITKLPAMSAQKRKVAAYARVSTGSDEQATSYEAQIDYYTNFIKENPAWEFVGVYADEGISGTNTKHREAFNRMLDDAFEGKIDLIVTKSVSRFARNTVDSLTAIRKLKEHGCECFFQKENIYTFDGKGEVLLTIMSSLAQEESRSISENVTWGHRKRFADGKIMLAYKNFLGYERGEDGIPKIVESEAEIIRRIYRMFAEGKTSTYIAKVLTEEGIPTPSGKNQWRKSTVINILTNEKYRGSALLQKSFTVDFLSKKMKKNEGEIPQYYIEESHPPIIDPEEWDWVQIEMKRRNEMNNAYRGADILSSKIICGDCGGFYGSKVWHSTDKYRKVIWQCNKKFSNGEKCSTPHFDEKEVKNKFVIAFNQLVGRREIAIEACNVALETLTDTATVDSKIDESRQELDVIVGLIEKCVNENASVALEQNAYNARYNSLVEKYKAAEEVYKKLLSEKERRVSKAEEIRIYIKLLEKAEHPIAEFDEKLWLIMTLHAIAKSDRTITFVFRDGMEITV